MGPIDSIIDLIETRGAEQYGDEAVSQREHALQCAVLAEAAGAAPALVAAALLHDIGHLVDVHAPGAAVRGIDRRHEAIGAGWLARHFGPEVVEPVRLHVPAKQWLCWAEPGYEEALSPASQRSLALQGGRFDAASASAFLEQPFADAAIALRRWDDAAKVSGLATPALAHFLPAVEAALRSS